MNYQLCCNEFVDIFRRSQNYKDAYSYEALEKIFAWYEENEPDFDFDFQYIVPEWTEYDSFDDLERNYHYLIVNDDDYNELEDDDEKQTYLIEEIKRNGAYEVYTFERSSSILVRE